MSLAKVIQIAHKSQSSKSWSAPVCINDLLERVRPGGDSEGVEQLVVHMIVKNPDGKHVHRWQAMGVSFEQHVALLEIARTCLIKDWLE